MRFCCPVKGDDLVQDDDDSEEEPTFTQRDPTYGEHVSSEASSSKAASHDDNIHSPPLEAAKRRPLWECGVQLAFVVDLLEELDQGFFRSFPSFTTEDVVKQYIMPRVGPYLCRYVDLLPSSMVFPATVYVSHRWKGSFRELVERLKTHFMYNLDPASGGAVSLWLDAFAINQTTSEEAARDRTQAKEVLFRTIYTVFSLDREGEALKRLWCQYELWLTVQRSAKRAGGDTLHVMSHGLGLQQILDGSIVVDVESSCVSLESDRLRIMREVTKQLFSTSTPPSGPDGHNTSRRRLAYLKFNEIIREALVRSLKAKTRRPTAAASAAASEKTSPVKGSSVDLPTWAPRQLERKSSEHEKDPSKDPSELIRSQRQLDALLASTRTLAQAGRLPEAQTQAQEAVQLAQRIHGPEHADVATALASLAQLHTERGDLSAARSLLEQALAIREKILGPEHVETAVGLHQLALVLRDQGHSSAARPLVERALRVKEAAHGRHHNETATCLNSLGLVLQDLGEYSEARCALEQALAIYEVAANASLADSTDPEHAYVATALNNLALVAQDEGDLPKAKQLFERSLIIKKRVYGQDHLEVALCLNNLAALLQEQGSFKVARQLFERSLAMKECAYGAESPKVAVALNNLALLLQDMGHTAEARQLLARSLVINKKVYGLEHPAVATSLNNMAGVLRDLGDQRTAKPLLERSLTVKEQAYSSSHPLVALALNNLALVAHARGDDSLARDMLQRSLAIRLRAHGGDHPKTAVGLVNLAALLKSQGDHKAADSMFTRALAIQEAAYSPKHPAPALTLKHIEAGAAGTVAATSAAPQDQSPAGNRRPRFDRFDPADSTALGGFLQTIKEDDFKGHARSLSISSSR